MNLGAVVNMQEHLRNRRSFPLEELAKHRGEWVTWSPDALDDWVRAAGKNPEDCPIEGILESDCVLGGLDVPW